LLFSSPVPFPHPQGRAAAIAALLAHVSEPSAAEGLAKLLFVRAVTAPAPLAALVREYFAEGAGPRTAQVLSVFFPAFAFADAGNAQLVASAAAGCIREAAEARGIAAAGQVARFMAYLTDPAGAMFASDAAGPIAGADRHAMMAVDYALEAACTPGNTASKACVKALATLDVAAAVAAVPTIRREWGEEDVFFFFFCVF
jgi:hypothetical protein